MKKYLLLALGVVIVFAGVKLYVDKESRDLVVSTLEREIAEEAEEIESVFQTDVASEESTEEIETEAEAVYDGHAVDRKSKVEGMVNMRDIGGYVGYEGKLLKEGVLFRSENLTNVTDQGLKDLEALNIKTIIDFRGQKEIDHHPDNLPEGINFINLPVTNPADLKELIPEEHMDEMKMSFIKGDFDRFRELMAEYDIDLEQSKKDRYVEFAEVWNKEFAEFMDIVVKNGANQGVLFHCEGGKDRTGFASALILKTLGVSTEDIMYDYMLTNEYFEAKNEELKAKLPEELWPTFIAYAAHLQASLDHIDEKYGDFDTYRRDVLQVSDDERDMLRLTLLK